VSIFKAYDIRGVVPDELDAAISLGIGRAAARFFESGPLAVGRDARPHSPELCDALIRGINDQGVDVIDLGLVSTPMLYHAVDRLGAGGGVMVTASHNPSRYNGFKLCREHAIPVGEASGLKQIEVLAGQRHSPAASRGTLCQEDVIASYVEQTLGVASGRPELRVAIDCGNGMAGVGLEPVLERMPLVVERLYFEPDGSFPNHEADPLKLENLEDLAAAVRRTGSDLGVAFDGDADRAVFVDEQGRPVSSDLVTAVLARHQLERQPGSKVLYDLRSSRTVPEEIEAAGGVPEMCRVGHSFVKAQMRESGAIFAGELSGHFYFRFSPTLVADDGIAAFVAMLDVLAQQGKPLSKIVGPLRRYSASGEINSRVADVPGTLARIESQHSRAPEISHLDGLLVRYPDWWFNLRPSNTEPVIRLNLEAQNEQRMAEERDRLLDQIRS
jgi:phosphomannomutase